MGNVEVMVRLLVLGPLYVLGAVAYALALIMMGAILWMAGRTIWLAAAELGLL